MRAINLVIDRFPGRSAGIRRLYLKDERFRAICEEYALSWASLRRFEERPDGCRRPEVEDYRTIIGELEDEIRACLASDQEQSRSGPRGGDNSK